MGFDRSQCELARQCVTVDPRRVVVLMEEAPNPAAIGVALLVSAHLPGVEGGVCLCLHVSIIDAHRP